MLSGLSAGVTSSQGPSVSRVKPVENGLKAKIWLCPSSLIDNKIVPCFSGEGREIEGVPRSPLDRVVYYSSSVGTVVGEIVGVSEAAKVGGGEEGVIEGWFFETFSATCTGEGLELLLNLRLFGVIARS